MRLAAVDHHMTISIAPFPFERKQTGNLAIYQGNSSTSQRVENPGLARHDSVEQNDHRICLGPLPFLN
jgi:hypothetical protein